MKEIFIVLSIALGILILVVIGGNKLSEINCYSQWEKSGMQVDYSFTSGCLIKLQNSLETTSLPKLTHELCTNLFHGGSLE